MAADGNQAQKETNNSFGLPKATFKPLEPTGSSNWLKITAIIVVIVLIIGAGVVYWLFKRSSSSYNDFMAKMLRKQQVEQEQSIQGDLENTSDDLMENADKQAGDFIEDLRNKALNEAQSLLEEQNKGFVQEIGEPQGQYYVIIASYIDRDLAMDYGKKLLKQHPNITLISPAKGKHFYRLAIDQGATFQEASEKATVLKADYGDQLWVLKY
jgi:hypothetical protein